MMAAPLAAAFGGAVRARNAAFERGWLRSYAASAPVISVGNLAVGGRGKTPTVIAIGGELRRRGIVFDVLTRGYRRRGRTLAVVRGGESVDEAGDEPLLIARALGVPVLVHADRRRAARLGEERCGARLHLLDDGFQRRQLRRDFDLVIVTARDLRDRMLPAGRLREPPASLARADAVLWLAAPGEAAAPAELAACTAAPVFAARKVALQAQVESRRPLAFCGLAEPDSFWATLAALRIAPAARVAFRDHHRYTRADAERLAAQARAHGADGFVTTEKDGVKLAPELRRLLAPLAEIRIALEIEGLERLVDLMLEQAGRRREAGRSAAP
ncbi:MAG TPA: tetraacyldisaccharide 4'-kinase [Terriglobales bacterium]|nr:tetraacyldisaccharide 4'-kinase [Terriglobales bacterium]